MSHPIRLLSLPGEPLLNFLQANAAKFDGAIDEGNLNLYSLPAAVVQWVSRTKCHDNLRVEEQSSCRQCCCMEQSTRSSCGNFIQIVIWKHLLALPAKVFGLSDSRL